MGSLILPRSIGMRQTEAGRARPMITLAGEAWIIEKLASEGII